MSAQWRSSSMSTIGCSTEALRRKVATPSKRRRRSESPSSDGAVGTSGKRSRSSDTSRRHLRRARAELGAQRVVGPSPGVGPQRLDEREVRHAELSFVAVAPARLRAAHARVDRELLGEAGLADARFADDEQEPTPARGRLVERGRQLGELLAPSDEAAERDRRRARAGRRRRRRAPTLGSGACTRSRRISAITSVAVAGRSSGSFSSNRSTSDSTAGGTSALCHEGATGAVLKCCEITPTASSPRNGGRPVSSS